MMNKKWLVAGVSLFLTFINYSVAYFLSSREVLIDYKNIALVFLFTVCWVLFYARKREKTIVVLYVLSVLFSLIVPGLALGQEPLFLQRMMKDFLYWYTLPLAFISLRSLELDSKIYRIILNLLVVVYSVISFIPLLVIISYYMLFSSLISVDGVMAILQTDCQEGIEFFKTYVNIPLLTAILILVAILVYRICKKLYTMASLREGNRSSLLGNRVFIVFITALFFVSNFAFLSKIYWYRTLKVAISREQSLENFQRVRKTRETVLLRNKVALEKTEKGVYALVIGETHARSNMSAYGYERDTTPWLTQAVRQGKVVLLGNGFSNAAQTTPALAYALTAKNQYNSLKFDEAFTITEIAKASGFEVIWVSNQMDDNIAGRIGHEATQQYWLNKKKNDTWMRQKNDTFDVSVIDCLKTLEVKNEKTLIVINLLGSHASYDCRYPEEFKKWDDSNSLLNSYDNSLLYNDYVMSEIYGLLFNKIGIDAMVYFADHGEELKIKFCHGNEYFKTNYKKHGSAKEIVKIPIYMAFSQKYLSKYPSRMDVLLKNKDLYYTNDMIYDTMLGIMHIVAPYYDSSFDITSSDYKMQLNDLRTLHGEVRLDECL